MRGWHVKKKVRSWALRTCILGVGGFQPFPVDLWEQVPNWMQYAGRRMTAWYQHHPTLSNTIPAPSGWCEGLIYLSRNYGPLWTPPLERHVEGPKGNVLKTLRPFLVIVWKLELMRNMQNQWKTRYGRQDASASTTISASQCLVSRHKPGSLSTPHFSDFNMFSFYFIIPCVTAE
jgi:hypothetical protein